MPPDSIGTRKGSAASAAMGRAAGPSVEEQRPRAGQDASGAGRRAAASSGRSRNGANCGVSQMWATSSNGVRSQRPGHRAARARSRQQARRARHATASRAGPATHG